MFNALDVVVVAYLWVSVLLGRTNRTRAALLVSLKKNIYFPLSCWL
jgi:hypothetical protein